MFPNNIEKTVGGITCFIIIHHQSLFFAKIDHEHVIECCTSQFYEKEGKPLYGCFHIDSESNFVIDSGAEFINTACRSFELRNLNKYIESIFVLSIVETALYI